MRFLKNCIFSIGILFLSTAIAAEEAASFVEAARNRIGAKTISTRSRMEISAKNGNLSERVIDQFSKDGAGGESRTMIVFQRPASVARTRFLTVQNKTGISDKWIFLPALAKTRRISSSEGSGSFMGTDLSYDDIASADRDVSLDAHSLAREDSFNGKAVRVIESIPKDKNYQYSKIVQWIGKNDNITYKLELYDKKGALHKIMEVLELKNIQGYETPVKTKMSSIKQGSSTVIYVENIVYDSPIPDSMFTQSYLETGRAQ